MVHKAIVLKVIAKLKKQLHTNDYIRGFLGGGPDVERLIASSLVVKLDSNFSDAAEPKLRLPNALETTTILNTVS